MKYKVVGILVALILVVGVGSWFFMQQDTKQEKGSSVETEEQEEIPTSASKESVNPEPVPDVNPNPPTTQKPTPVPSPVKTTTPPVTSPTPAGPKTYTMAEVAQHANSSSCWSSINGTVYDLTKWIAQHPGGEGNILSICGKDGTAAFEGQHEGDRKPNNILAGYEIGLLK